MNKKIYVSAAFVGLSLLPFVASAQLTSTQGLLTAAAGVVSKLILLASGMAMLYFLWGLAKYIGKVGAGSKTAADDGKNVMGWGILALFVLVSVYGIINFIASDLGITQSGVLKSGNSGGTSLPAGQITPCSGPCPSSFPSGQLPG